MALTAHDPVRHPAHYTMYPVESISICRHLGFCLGNVTKYTLRAPWKNGVEDCDKALEYLRLEQETPQEELDPCILAEVAVLCGQLVDWLEQQPGDELWSDIAAQQSFFVQMLRTYLHCNGRVDRTVCVRSMERAIRDLKRILALRDTTGQIYEGMTGRPQTQEAENA